MRDDDLLVGDIKETPREGSLLPDTYVFERGDTRQALIAHMAAAQTKLVNEIWQKRAARPADQIAGRTRHARLDRREGDRQGR